MNAIGKNLLNVLDQALAPDPFQRVREIVATGSAPSGIGRQHFYGNATPETFEQIGLRTPKPDAAVKELRAIRKQFQTLWGDHVRFGNRRTSELYQEYLAEQSAKILAGEETSDWFNEQEFLNERQAKLTSQKHALHQLSLQAHRLLLPIFESAIATARTMLAEELEVEIGRCEQWGIPMTEPSAVLLNIRAALQYYEARKAPPTSVASIDDLCVQTVTFD